MNRNYNELPFIGSTPTNTSLQSNYFNFIKKPIEIYVFIDPLCPTCWALEPYLKKLQLEYGQFFTLRPIINQKMRGLSRNKQNNTACQADINRKQNDILLEKPIQSSWAVYLAIKAAELQGKSAGKRFLRKIQEYLFLKKKDITDKNVLFECAESIDLDVQEFKRDLYSSTSKKALQCDMKLLNEMNVDSLPTVVFFNQLSNEDGVKVSGLYPYEIYVDLLSDMMNEHITSVNKPPLEEFLAHYKVVACKEIAIVYDWPLAKAKKEMKKLQLKQLAKEISQNYGSFWRFTGET